MQLCIQRITPKFFFLLIFVLLVCTSCVKRNSIKQEQNVQQEARLHDVPLIIDAYAVSVEQHNNDTGITYLTKQSYNEIAGFYIQEMECCGWKPQAMVHVCDELFLSFEKPSRICIISARPIHHNQLKLVICVTSKISYT